MTVIGVLPVGNSVHIVITVGMRFIGNAVGNASDVVMIVNVEKNCKDFLFYPTILYFFPQTTSPNSVECLTEIDESTI